MQGMQSTPHPDCSSYHSPKPSPGNLTPIQLLLLECLLYARARERLEATDFQVFGFKKIELEKMVTCFPSPPFPPIAQSALVLRLERPP